MSIQDDLYDISKQLLKKIKLSEDDAFVKPLSILEDVANKVGNSWSGSWFGYHSLVYYDGFKIPPPGARFSQECGLMDTYPVRNTIGAWKEYSTEDVRSFIMSEAGNPNLEAIDKLTAEGNEFFEDTLSNVLSKLTIVVKRFPDDTFLCDLLDQTKKIKVLDVATVLKCWKPSGQFVSRDMVAIEKGLMPPPHLSILAGVVAAKQPFVACKELEKISRRAASHLSNQHIKEKEQERIGTNVFIGHGRSHVWKDLRDFIKDRAHLPWDEFNRIPVVGVTNIARLSQMLDTAAIAFLVMTAEDEQADGSLQARMNVIHEVGLFQGRLGFERAIVLLEDGCEEFTNIQGLGQIRFPKGNISAVFETIRLVLEGAGLIEIPVPS